MESPKKRLAKCSDFLQGPLFSSTCIYGNLKVSSENHEPKLGDPSEQLFFKLHHYTLLGHKSSSFLKENKAEIGQQGRDQLCPSRLKPGEFV